MKTLPGKFVWFEVVTPDVAASQRFYGELLSWKVQPMPMGEQQYPMISAAGEEIGGWVPAENKGEACFISYISVEDVDATVEKITKNGGKLLTKPFDVPGVGRMAKVADAEGATACLFRSLHPDEDKTAAPKPGQVVWNELWTRDGKQALAFYEKTLGYGHQDMDMGPLGTYRVLESSGAQRGGVFTVPGTTPHWLPYIAVDDVDATVARAKKLKATIDQATTEVPGIGRWAVLRDPAGARFAVMKPAPRA